MSRRRSTAAAATARVPAILAAAAAAVGIGAAPACAQRDFSKVEIETQQVAEGIYMLKGAGGNIGVSTGDDGVLLVDDQFAPLTDKILAAVAKITDRPVRFVLNTHYHRDHVGGNENLGKAGALLVAHDAVRARLVAQMRAAGEHAPAADSPPPTEGTLPVITFDDSLTFHVNGTDVAAFHVAPAHTDGDAIVVFRAANVVHMGDCFFNGLYPYIDHEAGGGIEGMIAAIDRVLPSIGPETKVIPGHGPLSDRVGLVAFRDMLAAVRDRVKPLVAAGKTLDEVKAAKPTADFDAQWGNGFLEPDRWVEMVYEGLKKRGAEGAGGR